MSPSRSGPSAPVATSRSRTCSTALLASWAYPLIERAIDWLIASALPPQTATATGATIRHASVRLTNAGLGAST